MRRHVFERLVDVVQQVDPYFIQRPNCAGEIGLSALQKVVAAVRILAYGIPADAVDEYVRIGESTAHEALKHFCTTVQTAFAPYYLRAPNAEDIARLLQVGESCGFPGILGSVDCMHWEWRNCPSSWKGMFTGRGKHPTMILEAVASYDLWIWHAYFASFNFFFSRSNFCLSFLFIESNFFSSVVTTILYTERRSKERSPMRVMNSESDEDVSTDLVLFAFSFEESRPSGLFDVKLDGTDSSASTSTVLEWVGLALPC
jgi:hypothetical protein